MSSTVYKLLLKDKFIAKVLIVLVEGARRRRVGIVEAGFEGEIEEDI